MDAINVKWDKKMAFVTTVNGHDFIIDAEENVGGEDRGPRPKPLMLSALGGCTAMDVISILNKMRIVPDTFNVKVEGDVTNEHPKHYYQMNTTYELTGENISVEKVKKAVSLSEDRYCGVSEVYKQTMKLTSTIIINGEIIE